MKNFIFNLIMKMWNGGQNLREKIILGDEEIITEEVLG